MKTVGGGRKLRYCGVARNRFWMEMTTASYKLVRLSKLTLVSAQNLEQVCADHPQSTVEANQSPGNQRQLARCPNELYVHTEPHDPSLPTPHHDNVPIQHPVRQLCQMEEVIPHD